MLTQRFMCLYRVSDRFFLSQVYPIQINLMTSYRQRQITKIEIIDQFNLCQSSFIVTSDIAYQQI